MAHPSSPRCIVTGGAGFIGSNLAAALAARGVGDLRIVDQFDSDLKRHNLDGVKFTEFIDLAEFRRLVRADKAPPADAVFHLGACSSTTETNEDYLADNNTGYTRDLCEWCLRRGARFIYASSAATYGDGSRGYSDDDRVTPTLRPLNAYGRSKQAFDLWALEKKLLPRIAGIKYFNVYGPHEDHKGDMRSMVNKAYGQILKAGRMQLFKSHRPDYRDGEQVRDFVFVNDAVNVTLFFLDHPEVSGLFNCGTGRARTWLDLAHAVFAAMDRKPAIEFVDIPVSIRENYQYHTEADLAKLRKAGYRNEFTSIEDGVREYVRGYLAARVAPGS